MKDIAESTDITSSILSALYTTVLPTFIERVAQGIDSNKAIEESLEMVNNVSRKKFFDMLDILEGRLHLIDIRAANPINDQRIFFGDIEHEAISSISQVQNYRGIYLSYSRSSYKDALKIEPYLIQDLQKGEIMPKVYFRNEIGQQYCGVALFSAHQMGYIFINEQKNKRLGLRTISLQLPLFDHPSVLKGLYMSHDYNHNPIARRIVLIKHSNSIELEEFNQLKASIVDYENLTDEQKNYYDYTCCDGDYICSLMYASPVPNKEDLVKEKLMLKI